MVCVCMCVVHANHLQYINKVFSYFLLLCLKEARKPFSLCEMCVLPVSKFTVSFFFSLNQFSLKKLYLVHLMLGQSVNCFLKAFSSSKL